MKRPRFLPDNMTLLLLTVVLIASFFPARGTLALRFDDLSTGMIGLLFFMHGAKLSREAVLAGATHWRLHLLVLAVTFALFPLLGLVLKPALLPLVTPDLYLGILFLCVLPSTVQSSIAFTSVARGNVPAAVCSASASNLLGIVLTPLLVSVVIKASGDIGLRSGRIGWRILCADGGGRILCADGSGCNGLSADRSGRILCADRSGRRGRRSRCLRRI